MNHRKALVAFFAEMATKSVAIAHVPGDDREARRFFLWGSNEMALIGGYALNNTGWNLLLDMMPAGHMDNRHDSEARLFRVALHFTRVTSEQDLVAINTTVNDAYEIGWDFLLKAREHCQDPCNSDLTKANIPASLEWSGIKHQEIAPLLFIGDHHYGYRFEFDVRYLKEVPLQSDSHRWK